MRIHDQDVVEQVVQLSDGVLLLPVAEVTRRLGVGRTLVYELIRDGRLPSVRLAGRRLVAVADLEAFVEALRTDAGSSGGSR